MLLFSSTTLGLETEEKDEHYLLSNPQDPTLEFLSEGSTQTLEQHVTKLREQSEGAGERGSEPSIPKESLHETLIPVRKIDTVPPTIERRSIVEINQILGGEGTIPERLKYITSIIGGETNLTQTVEKIQGMLNPQMTLEEGTNTCLETLNTLIEKKDGDPQNSVSEALDYGKWRWKKK